MAAANGDTTKSRMIAKATVRVGDMIGNPEYPKSHFNIGVVIDQIPDDFLK